MRELERIIKSKPDFRTLVIEDQINMRRTIRNMLRLLGLFSVDEAGDGAEGWRKLKSEKFDLVLCDWNLPEMTGAEVLREVRAGARTANLPFVMITGETEQGTVAEVIETEVDGYILKPFVPQVLEEKIVEALSKRLNPSEVELSLRAVEEKMRQGLYEDAHQELDGAEEKVGASPRFDYARGLLFEGQGDLGRAEDCYQKARQMAPKFIKARERLAAMMERDGRSSELAQVLNEIVRISPRNADRQAKLGEAMLAAGKPDEAKRAFVQAMRLEPDNAQRLKAIGESFLSAGMTWEAEQAFKATLKADPADLIAYNRLGIAYRRQKKFQEAITSYRKALAVAPNEENVLFNLGRAYLEAGDRENAVLYVRKALQAAPGFKEAADLLEKIQGEKPGANGA